MERLPIEIIQSVVDVVDAGDRLSLRCVNKAFAQLATPLAFRSIHVPNSVVGAQNLLSLQKCPELRAHIKEMSFGGKERLEFATSTAMYGAYCHDNLLLVWF